ncbi:MAG TPA: four helix bundle protein [Desulfobacterales bacterium]|nr:four helix bundle protein [Desulfobacterales bacterium]
MADSQRREKIGFAFEDLQVYQRALEFSVAVIELVDRIDTPRKHYRLIEQLEASSTSVALNISEGKGRFSKKEFKHFLYVARGSLYETVTMLQIFLKLAWLQQDAYSKLYNEAQEINRMLSGLINSL